MKLLQQIAAGKLSLGAGDPSPPTPPGSGAAYMEGETRHFSRDARRRSL
jgi:hypothetical protein